MQALFKDRSAPAQFLILLALCFAGLLLALAVGSVLTFLIFPIEQSDIQALLSNPNSALGREISKFLQGVVSIGLFLIPALLAASLFSDEPESYVGANRVPQPFLLLVGLLGLLMLAGLGVSDALYKFTQSLPFPGELTSYFEAQELLMRDQYAMFLEMPNAFAFAKAFVLIAVLPAVCEETFFRGVLQPILKKGTGNRHLGIWITALVFAMIHFNFYGLLSILVLGAVLGYIREWTGSLWPSIILHLFNNGFIVATVYFADVSMDELNDFGMEENALWLNFASIAVFAILLWQLKRWFSTQVENI